MMCVRCGRPAPSVFVEYSPGNIRLSICARCHAPVDEYVEYEIMIVIIDMILHKSEAYRHLLFNYPRLHGMQIWDIVWKMLLLDLFLDTCIFHVKYAARGDRDSRVIQWDSLFSFLKTAGMVVTQVAFVNGTYLIFIIIASRAWIGTGKGPPRQSSPPRASEIIGAILLSSHFKLFGLVMLVWDFSSLMNFMVDILVFSSNAVALGVTCESATVQTLTVVIVAAMAKVVLGALIGLG